MTCRFAHDDAAYVLGALSPAERLEFERHLPGCGQCTRSVRELAGLPGLLGRIHPDMLDTETEEAVPGTLLPAVFREVRRQRRRRTFIGAGAAAAAAVVIGLTPLAVSNLLDGDNPTAVAPPAQTQAAGVTMRPVGDVPVKASLALESVTWGTKLDLTCKYDRDTVDFKLPQKVTYVLYVRTKDGRSEQVGTWRSVNGMTMRLSAATAATRADIASVQVRTLDGRVVLQLPA